MCDFMVWIKINIINRRIWRDDHFLEETLSKGEEFIMDHLRPELVCCRQDPPSCLKRSTVLVAKDPTLAK